ncbi:hypothetical protein M0812_13710 [Anaeramoeba flamelloides]|uniref:non-specific serine/threonine protein kinase n=1 Tax=Anaeramoeba flamelloides TaxID=1746091 RepID=A0AAV7ZKV2_9EUKA|nr:hypothetical protein M0812_13710 [Anaeramoeba flamelloides]
MKNPFGNQFKLKTDFNLNNLDSYKIIKNQKSIKSKKQNLNYSSSSESEISSEEENLKGYKPGGYHPTKPGEIFKMRYKAICKLGWGQFSIVWLVEDLFQAKFCALKIVKSQKLYREVAEDEAALLTKIQSKKGPNSRRVVEFIESFFHKGPNGKHYCLVFELLDRKNLLSLLKKNCYRGLPIQQVKEIAIQILEGLQHLHERCKIIHTDLKLENIMLYQKIGNVSKGIQKEIKKSNLDAKAILKTARIRKKVLDEIKKEKLKSTNSGLYKKKMDSKQRTQKKGKAIKSTEDSSNTNCNPNYECGFKRNENNNLVNGQTPVLKPDLTSPIIKVVSLKVEEMIIEKPEHNSNFSQDSKKDLGIDQKNDLHMKTQKEKKCGNEKKKERGTRNEKNKKQKPKTETETETETKRNSTIKRKKKRNYCYKIKNLTPKLIRKQTSNFKLEKQKFVLKRPFLLSKNKKQKLKNCTIFTLKNLKHKKKNIKKTTINKKIIFSTKKPKQMQSLVNCKIVDLGNSCPINNHFSTEIQTREYRSPEVIIGNDYNETADIWSLGCIIFELLTGDYLFHPKEGEDYSIDEDHLALIQETFGIIPIKFSLFGARSHKLIDLSDFKLKNIKNLQFCNLKNILIEKYNFSMKDAQDISNFLTPMFHYDINKRSSAKKCLSHPWLRDTIKKPRGLSL